MRAAASIQPPSTSVGERRQRVAAAQLGMAAAGDELLGLHEELDLADAAAPELDVVALDRDVLVAAVGVDLLLHRLDVGDRREVEILAPDERRQFLEDRLARGDVAGAGPRLDHRGALPVLPDAAVVVQRRRHRHRDRQRARPQMAVSVPAALNLYGSVRDNWERAAMIKARPSARPRCRGRAILVAVHRRKYLDYAAVVEAMNSAYRGHEGRRGP